MRTCVTPCVFGLMLLGYLPMRDVHLLGYMLRVFHRLIEFIFIFIKSF